MPGCLTGDAISSSGADAAEITLGYDTDAQGYDGTIIETGITEDQYIWDTSNLAVGRYYIYAIVNDGINETRFYSDVPVRVVADRTPLTNHIYIPTVQR